MAWAGLLVLPLVCVFTSIGSRASVWRRRGLVALLLVGVVSAAAMGVAGARAATEARACRHGLASTLTTFGTGLGLQCQRIIASAANADIPGLPTGDVVWLEDGTSARIVFDPATGATMQIGDRTVDG